MSGVTMSKREWVLLVVYAGLTVRFAWDAVADQGTFWRPLNAAAAVLWCVMAFLQVRDARRRARRPPGGPHHRRQTAGSAP